MSLLSLLFSLTVCSALTAPAELPTHGMPFGQVTVADVDRLEAFAQARDLDLLDDVKLAAKRDEAALARVFAFSREFTSLDTNARTYAQIIFSSLLNVGEVIGVEKYAQVLGRQPAEVQQHVRDILYYPMATAPLEQRAFAEAAARQMYPSLFPAGYQFAQDNPVFVPRTWAYWAHPARWPLTME